jgi:hypothetical protein
VRARLLLALAATLAFAPAAPVGAAADPAAPYRGLGAWISLYGREWRDPAGAVRALAAHHVATLYLETGRSTSPAAVERPAATAAFVDAAHAAGVRVVAWYYPTFRRVARDVARTLATARFQTPAGGAFDGVAADIEDPSVALPARRSRRAAAYTDALAAGIPCYPWGAITYPPVGLDLNAHAWPGYPWAAIARDYAAVLPMAYWAARTRTAAGAAWYAAGNLAALPVLTGRSDLVVHLIGSGGGGTAQAAAFAHAAVGGGAAGISLYPASRLASGEWTALAAALGATPPP